MNTQPRDYVLSAQEHLAEHDAQWELRQLTSKLRKKINKSKFEDTNKEAIVQWLDQISGISEQSREWCYLIKDTHEVLNLPEFDCGTVGLRVNAGSESIFWAQIS